MRELGILVVMAVLTVGVFYAFGTVLELIEKLGLWVERKFAPKRLYKARSEKTRESP